MGLVDCKWVRFETASFLVDGFQLRCPECRHYVLTHFHADHTVGLNKGFNCGTIYMSPETAALVQAMIKVDPQYIQVLEYHVPHVVDGVTLTLLPANHCPGAAIAIMRDKLKTVVHTGDCRASPEFVKAVAEAAPVVDELYLDTTYCSPTYSFWPQEVALREVERLVLEEKERDPNTLFVVGSYSIGKEKVALVMGAALQSAVYVHCSRRWRILGLSGVTNSAPNAFTHTIPQKRALVKEVDTTIDASITQAGPAERFADDAEAQSKGRDPTMVKRMDQNPIWQSDLTSTTPFASALDEDTSAMLAEDKDSFNGDAESGIDDAGLVGLRTREEERESESSEYPSLPRDFPIVHMVSMKNLKHDKMCELQEKYRASSVCGFRPTGWAQRTKAIKPWVVGRTRLYGVPYSEHSSFIELVDLVKTLKPKKIVPTVNASTSEQRDALLKLFRPYMDRSADKGCIEYYLARWKNRKSKAVSTTPQHGINEKSHVPAASSRDMPTLASTPIYSGSIASNVLPKSERSKGSNGGHREEILLNDGRIAAQGTRCANDNGGHAWLAPRRTIIDLGDDDDGYASSCSSEDVLPVVWPECVHQTGVLCGREEKKQGRLDEPGIDRRETACGGAEALMMAHVRGQDIAIATYRGDNEACGEGIWEKGVVGSGDNACAHTPCYDAREKCQKNCPQLSASETRSGDSHNAIAQRVDRRTRENAVRNHTLSPGGRGDASGADTRSDVDALGADAGGGRSAARAGSGFDKTTRAGHAPTRTGDQNVRVPDDNVAPRLSTFTKNVVVLHPPTDDSCADRRWTCTSDDTVVTPDGKNTNDLRHDVVNDIVERQLPVGDSLCRAVNKVPMQQDAIIAPFNQCDNSGAAPAAAVESSATCWLNYKRRGSDNVLPINAITDCSTPRRVLIIRDSDDCPPVAQSVTRDRSCGRANPSSKCAGFPAGLRPGANGNDVLPQTDTKVPRVADIVGSAACVSDTDTAAASRMAAARVPDADTAPANGMAAACVSNGRVNGNSSTTVFDEEGGVHGNGQTIIDTENGAGGENEGQKDSRMAVDDAAIAEKVCHNAVHTRNVSATTADGTLLITPAIVDAASTVDNDSTAISTQHMSPTITGDKRGRRAVPQQPRKRMRWHDAERPLSHSPTRFLDDRKNSDQAGGVEHLRRIGSALGPHHVEGMNRVLNAGCRQQIVDLDSVSGSDEENIIMMPDAPRCPGDTKDPEGGALPAAEGGQQRIIMLDSDDE
eukprot:GEMP01004153.1.p1 GENE.GEMP01004153.1~~GEMP01004153.1.p1  ORF type:complete len:1242 (+),score=270.45 GEMP01004153.1:88-3813(+)